MYWETAMCCQAGAGSFRLGNYLKAAVGYCGEGAAGVEERDFELCGQSGCTAPDSFKLLQVEMQILLGGVLSEPA